MKGLSSQTQILPPTQTHLTLIQKALTQKKIVALPTETVYGLTAHAFSTEALHKVFQIKGRPKTRPFIIHLASRSQDPWEDLKTAQLVDWKPISPSVQKSIKKLVQSYWPGPLTLVLPKTQRVPSLCTNHLPTVAIRMPNHFLFQQVLNSLSFPVIATSANYFQHKSPTTAQSVFKNLKGKIPFILDGGPCQYALESTIIQPDPHTPDHIKILRNGSISRESLKKDFYIHL